MADRQSQLKLRVQGHKVVDIKKKAGGDRRQRSCQISRDKQLPAQHRKQKDIRGRQNSGDAPLIECLQWSLPDKQDLTHQETAQNKEELNPQSSTVPSINRKEMSDEQ